MPRKFPQLLAKQPTSFLLNMESYLAVPQDNFSRKEQTHRPLLTVSATLHTLGATIAGPLVPKFLRKTFVTVEVLNTGSLLLKDVPLFLVATVKNFETAYLFPPHVVKRSGTIGVVVAFLQHPLKGPLVIAGFAVSMLPHATKSVLTPSARQVSRTSNFIRNLLPGKKVRLVGPDKVLLTLAAVLWDSTWRKVVRRPAPAKTFFVKAEPEMTSAVVSTNNSPPTHHPTPRPWV